MTCFTSTLAAILLTASVSVTAAQTSTGATSQTPAGAAAEALESAFARFRAAGVTSPVTGGWEHGFRRIEPCRRCRAGI
jgi:hypothetical protein